MHWRAWYTGARDFSGGWVDWRDLPATGCLGVVADYGTHREIHCGEWHWLEGDHIRSIPGALPGVYVPAPDGVPYELLKQGETVPYPVWVQVLSEINAAGGIG